MKNEENPCEEWKDSVDNAMQETLEAFGVLRVVLKRMVKKDVELENRIKRLEGLYGIGEAGKN